MRSSLGTSTSMPGKPRDTELKLGTRAAVAVAPRA